MNKHELTALAERVEAAEGPQLFDWLGNPTWAQEGREHYDGGWVPDCQGKMDFDPGLLRLSCRTYPSGQYVCSAYFGDDIELETTGILRATDQVEARVAVEEWCDRAARRYRDLVAAALRSQGEGHGD